MAGSWSEILHGVDVADQRAMMEPLVDSVRLERMRWGMYTANITWTKLGKVSASLSQPVFPASMPVGSFAISGVPMLRPI